MTLEVETLPNTSRNVLGTLNCPNTGLPCIAQTAMFLTRWNEGMHLDGSPCTM